MSLIKDLLRPLIPGVIKKKIRVFYQERNRANEMAQYKGDNVYCTVCKSSFKVFATAGLTKRENARCVNCGSLERHRLLSKYLFEELNILNKGKIRMLHFAPERFFFDVFSNHDNVEYYPCDLFPESYAFEGKSKVLKVDITKIPFEDNFFDVILCNHVLEHIPNDRLAMEELYRVMKNNGWGIFQVPLDYSRAVTYEDFSITTPNARQKAFGQNDHVRWYGRDYTNRLMQVGFNVTSDNYVQRFSKEEAWKFGFETDELIYLCRKR